MSIKLKYIGLAASLVFASFAHTASASDNPSIDQVLKSLSGKDFSELVLTDSGEGAALLRMLNNPNCGRSRHDHDYRSNVIARKNREFFHAVNSQDDEGIIRAAAALEEVRHRSSMYEKCYTSMQNASEAVNSLSEAAQKILELYYAMEK